MGDHTTTHGGAAGPARTLAQKIDHLFAAALLNGRTPSHEEVATAINIAAGEKTISATYVWQLRTGKKTNPTKRHLEALAKHFGVSPAYFLDDVEAERIDEQLALLKAIREADVRAIALRSCGLSEASRRSIAALVSQLRELEGLDVTDVTPPGPSS
ncbi:helix-turn-helix transcriptional regulator [Streptomyces roseoverticillatus]|uniref:helix-turn-helix domain-containing protein n=1 Tax=Streptomyces roseoverticillatus TaxID=66429 RepID=UPI001F221A0A|nr:helix-turn-helix transcriptional regulator [Streptomyces roseoverticillatus]MCF3105982.1 helix-turn-helix transcriptional regulator [Streptomyces roseoverticillatus]